MASEKTLVLPSRVAKAAVLLCFCIFSSAGWAMQIPAQPPRTSCVYDFANLLDGTASERIASACRQGKKQSGATIVVVTISSKSNYKSAEVSIEDLAKAWFNKWQIGSKLRVSIGRRSGLIHSGPKARFGDNLGILLIVSKSDREARIELGKDFGGTRNAEAQAIMNGRIVPAFKSGKFGVGIEAGVNALAEWTTPQKKPSTATLALKASAPAALPVQPNHPSVPPTPMYSSNPTIETLLLLGPPVSLWWRGLILIAGCCLWYLGHAYQRKWLQSLGVLTLAIGLIMWVVVVIGILWLLFFIRRSGRLTVGRVGGRAGGGGASGRW